jgi:hypothetical protein
MFKKAPKPSFLVSAELHSRIRMCCSPIEETDSRILDVRPVRHSHKLKEESKTVNRDFACCFVAH